MKFWICVTNSENWEVIKDKNIWGVSDRHKNTIARVEIGDKLIIYGVQEKIGENVVDSRIYGIFEAKSKAFRDSKKIFRSKDETFPNRIKIFPINIPEQPVPFKPLIEKLRFITNKKKWNTHLYGRAMREIPRSDYETIKQALEG